MCFKHCQYAHFIRQLHFCLIIIEHQLLEPRAVQKSDRNVLFVKEVKQELWDPATAYCICMDRGRYSESLVSLRSSELAERRVFICQELRFFQGRTPPQDRNFHSLHDFFRKWNRRNLIRLLKTLHRTLNGLGIFLKVTVANSATKEIRKLRLMLRRIIRRRLSTKQRNRKRKKKIE